MPAARVRLPEQLRLRLRVATKTESACSEATLPGVDISLALRLSAQSVPAINWDDEQRQRLGWGRMGRVLNVMAD